MHEIANASSEMLHAILTAIDFAVSIYAWLSAHYLTLFPVFVPSPFTSTSHKVP